MGDGGNGHGGPKVHGDGQSDNRHETDGQALDGDDLRARLEKLTGALAAQHRSEHLAPAKGREQEETGSSPGAPGNVLSLAFRVTSEFVAAVFVGTAIGWGIDRVAGTSPIFLIAFVLMGSAAGFWNVYRIGTEKPGAQRK